MTEQPSPPPGRESPTRHRSIVIAVWLIALAMSSLAGLAAYEVLRADEPAPIIIEQPPTDPELPFPIPSGVEAELRRIREILSDICRTYYPGDPNNPINAARC